MNPSIWIMYRVCDSKLHRRMYGKLERFQNFTVVFHRLLKHFWTSFVSHPPLLLFKSVARLNSLTLIILLIRSFQVFLAYYFFHPYEDIHSMIFLSSPFLGRRMLRRISIRHGRVREAYWEFVYTEFESLEIG